MTEAERYYRLAETLGSLICAQRSQGVDTSDLEEARESAVAKMIAAAVIWP